MLSPLDSRSQVPSYVTLTVTFDLDLGKSGQGQSFEKKSNFFQPSRVVYQVKGLGPLIPEIQFFCPYDVTGRHNNVINDVKITLLPITQVLIAIETSC